MQKGEYLPKFMKKSNIHFRQRTRIIIYFVNLTKRSTLPILIPVRYCVIDEKRYLFEKSHGVRIGYTETAMPRDVVTQLIIVSFCQYLIFLCLFIFFDDVTANSSSDGWVSHLDAANLFRPKGKHSVR